MKNELHNPKSRVIAAGISQVDLAEAASVSRPYLSQHLSGQRRNAATQKAIYDAYVTLGGPKIGLAKFWGGMLKTMDKGQVTVDKSKRSQKELRNSSAIKGAAKCKSQKTNSRIHESTNSPNMEADQ